MDLYATWVVSHRITKHKGSFSKYINLQISMYCEYRGCSVRLISLVVLTRTYLYDHLIISLSQSSRLLYTRWRSALFGQEFQPKTWLFEARNGMLEKGCM
jgi:hypothetical protein